METALLDREVERGQIDRALAMARQGRGAALVLQGEPGTPYGDYFLASEP